MDPTRWAPDAVINGVYALEMAENQWVSLGLFRPTEEGL